jgi:hypothetical protein
MTMNVDLQRELLMGTKEFFANRSFSDLAKMQGVKPLDDPFVLLGGWPDGEDIDEFIEHIYKERNAQSLLRQTDISRR